MSIVRMSSEELAKVKEYLQKLVDEEFDMNEPENEIVAIEGIGIDPEWAKTQDWYQTVSDMVKIEYPPQYIVRTLDLSNTGWNWILRKDEEGNYSTWHLEDLMGSAPAYQGCYEYDENDNMISDEEALEWVAELYNDYEDVWV